MRGITLLGRIEVVRSLFILSSLMLGVCLPTSAFAQTSTSVADYWPPTRSPNGWTVYLAAATHSGNNQGCPQLSGVPYTETEGAQQIGFEAITATGFGNYLNLRGRGYHTWLSSPLDSRASISRRLSDARALGIDIYLPIHSNAGRVSCDALQTNGGAWQMYAPDIGGFNLDLAQKLNALLSPVTPGTNDRVDKWDNLVDTTRVSNLREATEPTSANPALSFALSNVYIESEFHSWQPGVNYILYDNTWKTRIAEAVSWHLGYPEIY